MLSIVALIAPTMLQAAVAYRVALISEIQSSAAASDVAPRLVYVAQGSGQWVGSINCPQEWAYFDARLNPHFMAMALSAEATQKPIRVYVDDSLPKINGWCQAAYLSLLPM